jgi:hypothetical protein
MVTSGYVLGASNFECKMQDERKVSYFCYLADLWFKNVFKDCRSFGLNCENKLQNQFQSQAQPRFIQMVRLSSVRVMAVVPSFRIDLKNC